jgi:hypothetical protein
MVEKSEAFPRKYWSASDLKTPAVLEIEAVNIETLKGRDGSTSQKPVVYFTGTTKRLACNGTNFDLLVSITGEADSDDWAGHRVELFATTTMMGSATVPCVRARAPSTKSKAKAKTPTPPVSESEDPASGLGSEFA